VVEARTVKKGANGWRKGEALAFLIMAGFTNRRQVMPLKKVEALIKQAEETYREGRSKRPSARRQEADQSDDITMSIEDNGTQSSGQLWL
jgi:hypothetical protein